MTPFFLVNTAGSLEIKYPVEAGRIALLKSMRYARSKGSYDDGN